MTSYSCCSRCNCMYVNIYVNIKCMYVIGMKVINQQKHCPTIVLTIENLHLHFCKYCHYPWDEPDWFHCPSWPFRFFDLIRMCWTSSQFGIYEDCTTLVDISFFILSILETAITSSHARKDEFSLVWVGDSHKSCTATLRGLLYIFLHQRLPTGRKESVTQTLPLRSACFKTFSTTLSSSLPPHQVSVKCNSKLVVLHEKIINMLKYFYLK